MPALAPILGSWLTQQFGWRANFSFMTGFALLVGLAMALRLQESNPYMDSRPAVFKLSRYAAVLKAPTFLFHASLCLLAMAVILAYVTSAPVILMERLQ
ncbi:MFS transporter, partial [Klebsiella variicola]|uniref:MFS transporter n=1 Tax=Klebsiella variicola TaxID=244366 RepID=UPI0034D1DF74